MHSRAVKDYIAILVYSIKHKLLILGQTYMFNTSKDNFSTHPLLEEIYIITALLKRTTQAIIFSTTVLKEEDQNQM